MALRVLNTIIFVIPLKKKTRKLPKKIYKNTWNTTGVRNRNYK